MYSIHLDKLLFFAHHGMHDEERVTGTHFEVCIDLGFAIESTIEKLADTVDYSEVYKIVQAHMKQPAALLEKLAGKMADDIQQYDKRIHTINIRINKLQPPIANFTGNVGVSISKSY
ncbi:MAG: dihydroneopterin aldolase [Ferruginibacter sp.]